MKCLRFLALFVLLSYAAVFSVAVADQIFFNKRNIPVRYNPKDKKGEKIVSAELWYTMDGGKTWRLYGKDDDGKSPIIFKAPSDGLFGFYTVAVDKHGNMEQSPVGGTKPHAIATIDTTAPSVGLIRPGNERVLWKGGEKHAVLWKAEDAHLLEKPISLEYSIDSGKTWEIIVSKMENTGRYLWEVPKIESRQCLIKLHCLDSADNIGSAVNKFPFTIYTKSKATGTSTLSAEDKARSSAILRLATVMRTRGDFRRALKEYERVLSIHPDNVSALNDIALVYIELKNYDAAKASFEKATKLEPEENQMALNLARLYMMLDNDNNAYKILTGILKRDPVYEEALWSLSMLYEERKNYIESKKLWSKIVNTSRAYSKRRLMAQDKLLLYEDVK